MYEMKIKDWLFICFFIKIHNHATLKMTVILMLDINSENYFLLDFLLELGIFNSLSGWIKFWNASVLSCVLVRKKVKPKDLLSLNGYILIYIYSIAHFLKGERVDSTAQVSLEDDLFVAFENWISEVLISAIIIEPWTQNL